MKKEGENLRATLAAFNIVGAWSNTSQVVGICTTGNSPQQFATGNSARAIQSVVKVINVILGELALYVFT